MTTTIYTIPGFPAPYLTEDGERMTIRPMLPTDGDALLAFFRRMPEEDRFSLRRTLPRWR